MIRTIFAKDFAAVPYLEGSRLMQSHPDGIGFSTEKPNVIVGPNGAGKSALMKTLSLLTLSYQMGVSALEGKYLDELRSTPLWGHRGQRWNNDHVYLPGLEADSDFAPAIYYRPGHVPGNERMVTSAMMTGYFDEAKEYARLTDKKSSGQQCSALLSRVEAVLAGDVSTLKRYDTSRWGCGVKPSDLSKVRYPDDRAYRIEVFKARYGRQAEDVLPVLLMDEPEQSLDARSELEFWRKVAAVDTTKVQVIAATHSLYPILNPDRFHLIEAEPGYAESVRALT
jgi:energy-coupling factor transporter ATP-binding protein EcfA2